MELRYESSFPSNGWLFDRMNGLFNDFTAQQRPRGIRPVVDVVEDKEGYHFYFDMPGLKSDSLDLRVENDKLTVTVERKRPQWPSESTVHFSERHFGQIRRTFELPEDASREKIHASYKDGVLEVMVEKRPESKPVKIQIN
jgi:HSP20 family protein